MLLENVIQWRIHYGSGNKTDFEYLKYETTDQEFTVGKGDFDQDVDIIITGGGVLVSREHLKIRYAKLDDIFCWQVKNQSDTYESVLWYRDEGNKVFLGNEEWVPLKTGTGIYLGPNEQGKNKGVVIEFYNRQSVTTNKEVSVDWDTLFINNNSWFDFENPEINEKKINLTKSEINVLKSLYISKLKSYLEIMDDSKSNSESVVKKHIDNLNNKFEEANNIGHQFVRVKKIHSQGALLIISDN